MHTLNIAHRDLKPANILVNKDKSTNKITLKIADFGLSHAFDENFAIS